MGNKSLRRHSNVSFLFIISQVVKKESDLLVSNVSNLVFSNGGTCKVSSKIFDNTFCAVNIAIANVKEKSFVFFVKLRSSIFSGFLNLLVGMLPFSIILRTWYFHCPAIVSTLKYLIFLNLRFLLNPPNETMA